jgi:hypothetical protein
MSQLDRPERPPRGPRPAADEGQDPVDYRPAATTPAPTTSVEGKDTLSVSAAAPTAAAPPTSAAKPVQVPADAPRRREQTVQLATRVSPGVAALIDAAAARTGYSKRNVIEQAIQQFWGES